MEKNEICNSKIKQTLADLSVHLLLSNKLIEENELLNFNLEFGYIFTKEDGNLEALMKAICNGKNFYFAYQKGSFMLISINESQYNETINYMKEYHPCINDISNSETEKQKERREKNNKYLTENGISINEKLHCYEYDIQMKSLDDICKRAIAALITIQVACDINNGIDIKSEEYKDNFNFINALYEKFNVKDCLNSKEKRIIDGTYSNQDPIDMDWAYEAYWSLCWCLSLVDDIKNGGETCDCDKAIALVLKSTSFDDFKSKCKLRDIDEILDMKDLYFRYHWAINNKYVNPESKTGNLNPSNVLERRRGLEWVVSNDDDWYDIQLNA